MKLIASLKDNEFPYNGTENTRRVVRTIVLDENNNLALHHLYGVLGEEFGFRDYYETPGGGVKSDETLEEALKRECLEELGYEIEFLSEIGEIDDYYNLLKRKNLNHYFLCRRIGEKKPINLSSRGDQLIKETVWVSFTKARELYENHLSSPLAKLVYNREIKVLELGENILKNLLDSI